jgi:hypothetical protein
MTQPQARSNTGAQVALTPKTDQQGVKVRLRAFWRTTRLWTPALVADFQQQVPAIAQRLRVEQYWNKDGQILTNRFTCEDFALRVLCDYASAHGLPLKLTTGVRTYRNMEIFNAKEHSEYGAHMLGFAHMVMRTYGAPDMQRLGANAVAVASPEALLPGDILALAHDAKGAATGGRAHHIQLVVGAGPTRIAIFQGNSDSTIHRPITWFNRVLGRNAADPAQQAYAGMPVETGGYTKNGKAGWDYVNNSSGRGSKDFLKQFDLVRWNFMEFNR